MGEGRRGGNERGNGAGGKVDKLSAVTIANNLYRKKRADDRKTERDTDR